MSKFTLLLLPMLMMPYAAYGVGSVASFIGCLGRDLDEPKVKVFDFSANIVTEDSNGMHAYTANGVCAYERQVCEGGTLFNSWDARSDEFKVITGEFRRWVIKLSMGRELNFDFPGCERLIHSTPDDNIYHIWLTNNPKALPHQQHTVWRKELINEESLRQHGIRLMHASFDIK